MLDIERRKFLKLLGETVLIGGTISCQINKQLQEICFPAVETPDYVALRGKEVVSASRNMTIVNHDTTTSVSIDPKRLQEFVNSPNLGDLNLPENVVFIVHFVPTSLKTKELREQAANKYTSVALDITILRERMRELEKQNKKLPPQRPVNILISIPDAIKRVEDRFTSENQKKESCPFQLLLGTYLSLAIFGSIANTMSKDEVVIKPGKLKTLTDFEDEYKPIKVRLNGEFLSNLLK